MRPRDYLGAGVPELRIKIVECAHDDIGSGEDLDAAGRGTNRSLYCDRVNTRFGSPLGSPWCANAGAGWWRDGGAPALPPEPGSCESWRLWAIRTGRFRTQPLPGYAVLYGTSTHAEHWELVARLVPDITAHWGVRVLVIGGNTSLGRYNRDGWIVAEKIMDATRLIGFVAPLASDP